MNNPIKNFARYQKDLEIDQEESRHAEDVPVKKIKLEKDDSEYDNSNIAVAHNQSEPAGSHLGGGYDSSNKTQEAFPIQRISHRNYNNSGLMHGGTLIKSETSNPAQTPGILNGAKSSIAQAVPLGLYLNTYFMSETRDGLETPEGEKKRLLQEQASMDYDDGNSPISQTRGSKSCEAPATVSVDANSTGPVLASLVSSSYGEKLHSDHNKERRKKTVRVCKLFVNRGVEDGALARLNAQLSKKQTFFLQFCWHVRGKLCLVARVG